MFWRSPLPSCGCFLLPSQVALSSPGPKQWCPQRSWPLDQLGACCDQAEHPPGYQLSPSWFKPCLTTPPSLLLVNHLFTMQGTRCKGHTWGWSGSRQGLRGQHPLPAQHTQLADVISHWKSAQVPLPCSSFHICSPALNATRGFIPPRVLTFEGIREILFYCKNN